MRGTGRGGQVCWRSALSCFHGLGVVLCCALMQEEGITELLLAPGKLADRIPGISGTRNLSDNLSDLKAQVGQPCMEEREGRGRGVCTSTSRRTWGGSQQLGWQKIKTMRVPELAQAP